MLRWNWGGAKTGRPGYGPDCLAASVADLFCWDCRHSRVLNHLGTGGCFDLWRPRSDAGQLKGAEDELALLTMRPREVPSNRHG